MCELTGELVVDCKCTLGEGPLWDAAAGLLYWVDIISSLIYWLDPATAKVEQFDVGEHVGAVALRQNGGLIAATATGISFVDVHKQKVQPVTKLKAGTCPLRFNDGKVDPAGRFWAGTLAYDEAPGVCALYRLDPGVNPGGNPGGNPGALVQMLDGITCSNGLAWSADRQTMYYIDSPTLKVEAFDYDDADGHISNRRTAITIPDGAGFPDGMTIDAEDKLWVAFWGAGQVRRYDPATGQVLATVHVPATQTTSCAFGGPQLDTLYITTANEGLDAPALAQQPQAGGLFAVKPGVRGVAGNLFAG